MKDCEFVVFKGALENGGSVRGINAEGQGHMPRKKIDALVEYAKGFGAKGLAYIAINEDGTFKSSFAKFMKEEEMVALIAPWTEKRAISFSLQQIRTRLYSTCWATCVWSWQDSWIC